MDGKPFRIFVVDDDEWYRKLLEYNFSLNPDYEVFTFSSGKDCLKNLSEHPDLISLDYRLPDMDGAEVMRRIHSENAEIAVVIISEQEEIEVAVELLKQGAYDYLVKSKEIQGRLLALADRVRNASSLRERVSHLQKEVEQKYEFQRSIVGESKVMQEVYHLMAKAAGTNLPVLVTGETGTGKELVARAIHYNSKRKEKPFVAVNVGAIPRDLVESELFGHEKGAFTGAIGRRIGKFEEAHGGTLFLDEIGEMDMSIQVKLLRVLQEKEVTRVGSNKTIATDCRIITATHRDLQEAIREKTFREDLYYRLFGLPVELPPLRERGNDILLLARRFIEDFCKENEIAVARISQEAGDKLLSCPFPGNVRQLKSMIELAVVTCEDGVISAGDIRTQNSDDVLPEVMHEQLSLRAYNHRILQVYLERNDNDIPKVAELLDISVATIYRMLKEIKGEAE